MTTGTLFGKKVLANGLKVVWERMPSMRSVTFGVWVGTGSRNETAADNGISHFTEHMLFKGTERRNAREIAEAIDNIGGQINAFTGKEVTCFYTKTLDSHLETAMDVISDMILNSKFDEADINMERNVILEEINMEEDTPEDAVHEYLAQTAWKTDAIGMPILGTQKALANVVTDTFKDYTGRCYRPENCVVAIAGSFDIDKLEELADRYFGSWKSGGSVLTNYSDVKFTPGVRVQNKKTEQLHLCIGFEGIAQEDKMIFPLSAINAYLGGGMSSVLFQEIREKRGLAYSVYSYIAAYKGAGLFTIYCGMKAANLETVNQVVMQELATLKKDGMPGEALKNIKEQLKGSFILGQESSSSRMNNIGKSFLLYDRIRTQDETLALIDAITDEDIYNTLEKVFSFDKIALSAIGPVKEDRIRKILQ